MALALLHRQFLVASIVGVTALLLHIEDDDDTLLVVKQVRLPSPVVKTFKYVSHLHNMKFWTPGLTKFDPLDNHPVGLGKRYIEAYHIPFYGELEFECIVLGFESPRHVGFVCNNWLKTRVEMNLERSDLIASHPTLMTFRVFSRRKSYLFKYVVSPMISFYEEASTRQAMFALKYALEMS